MKKLLQINIRKKEDIPSILFSGKKKYHDFSHKCDEGHIMWKSTDTCIEIYFVFHKLNKLIGFGWSNVVGTDICETSNMKYYGVSEYIPLKGNQQFPYFFTVYDYNYDTTIPRRNIRLNDCNISYDMSENYCKFLFEYIPHRKDIRKVVNIAMKKKYYDVFLIPSNVHHLEYNHISTLLSNNIISDTIYKSAPIRLLSRYTNDKQSDKDKRDVINNVFSCDRYDTSDYVRELNPSSLRVLISYILSHDDGLKLSEFLGYVQEDVLYNYMIDHCKK